MLINSILYKPGADFKSFLAVLKAWLQGLGNPGHCGVFLCKTDQTKGRNERLSSDYGRTSLTEHRTWALAGILPSIDRNRHFHQRYDWRIAAREGSMMLLTTVAVFVTLTGVAIAQDNPPGKESAPAPKFDVASIKPVAPGARMIPSRSLP